MQLKTSEQNQMSSGVHKPFQEQKNELQVKITQILHWNKRQTLLHFANSKSSVLPIFTATNSQHTNIFSAVSLSVRV